LIGLGGIVSAGALAAFPLATSFWHLLILNLLVGAAAGLAFPSHIALAMEYAPGFGMGTVMSVLLMVHSLGMTIGPILLGVIADQYTLNGVFYGVGLIGGLTTIICYILTNTPSSALQPVQAAEEEPTVAD
jgi:MFS family permease